MFIDLISSFANLSSMLVLWVLFWLLSGSSVYFFPAAALVWWNVLHISASFLLHGFSSFVSQRKKILSSSPF